MKKRTWIVVRKVRSIKACTSIVVIQQALRLLKYVVQTFRDPPLELAQSSHLQCIFTAPFCIHHPHQRHWKRYENCQESKGRPDSASSINDRSNDRRPDGRTALVGDGVKGIK